MKSARKIILLVVLILIFQNDLVLAQEIIIENAETVWNSNLDTASDDVLDSSDAPLENTIKYAFVGHAESIWNSELSIPSSDVTDSTDTPVEKLIKFAFIGHGESVAQFGLEGEGWSPQTDKWSFVIITDLHIGWGIPDYDSGGYSDNTIGQNYFITERLKKTIQWINENYRNPDYNIKFVVVTGDISDTAEYSEFITARNILNELKIPYIPIIGNHDIWPYIQKINSGPDGGKLGRITSILERVQDKTVESLGDEYFETVFWGSNNPNVQRINNLFSDFERQEEKEGYQGAPYFQNYSFSYRDLNFISLDFASRDFWELMTPINASNYPVTINWLEERLKGVERENVVVFTHYPTHETGGFKLWDLPVIRNYFRNCNCQIFNFAGHTHINRIGSPGDEYDVVETEPTSQIPVAPGYNLTGELIRIIQITDENSDINYDTLIDGFPTAINPYFTVSPGEVSANNEITFKAYTKNLEPEEILSYDWDFDRNYSAQCIRPDGKNFKCTVIYNQPGVYKVTLKVIPNSNPNYYEELSWNLEVKAEAKPWWKIFGLGENLNALLNGEEDEDATQNPQNTSEWVVITKVASPGKPVGAFNVHFEEVTEDIDLSNLVADIDLDTKKSILHMHQWPTEIEESKVLFLPKNSDQ